MNYPKKLIILILFLPPFLYPLGTGALIVEELKSRIADKEKEIQALEAEAEAHRKNIEVTLGRANTLKREVAKIDSEIKQLSYNLSITQKKIEATELKIEELNSDIDETEHSIATRHQEISEIIRVVEELDNDTLLATMLKTEKLSDFFSQVVYLDGLQRGLLEKVSELRVFKAELEDDLSASEKAGRRLNELSSSLQSQRRISEGKRQERRQLLAETKNQEQNYQRLLQETIKRQEAIEKEIFELESELRRQIVSANLPPRQPGLFAWPVDNGYVTQEFGAVSADSYTHRFYQFHNGIDFGARTGIGTPIRAVMDGVVAASGSNGRYAYGKWVAIRHPNNLVTMYAHLSLIGVSTGQTVTRGQIIGYMGVTGLATGPHLHLTVYAGETFRVENRWFGPLPLGGAINPRDYL